MTCADPGQAFKKSLIRRYRSRSTRGSTRAELYKDRIGIFHPKIEATAKRLTSIVELIKEFPDAPKDHIRKFKHFLERLLDLRDALDERAPTIVAAQWQSLDWGLKEIGKISFGGIRRNYETVLRRVVEVVDNGYFEFL